jgi:hypothetical protein
MIQRVAVVRPELVENVKFGDVGLGLVVSAYGAGISESLRSVISVAYGRTGRVAALEASRRMPHCATFPRDIYKYVIKYDYEGRAHKFG